MKCTNIIGTIAFLFFGIAALSSGQEKNDPFADADDSKKVDPRILSTTGEFEVSPLGKWNPELLEKEGWPKITPPTTFNDRFREPAYVWRVNSGYFAVFNAGEFGAGFFYADREAKKWTRILNAHIQSIEQFAGDKFLIAGGLAHLSSAMGTAHILSRNKKGEWITKKVFQSNSGRPRIIGLTATGSFEHEDSEKLIVIGISYPDEVQTLFGITSKGVIYHLGDRSEK